MSYICIYIYLFISLCIYIYTYIDTIDLICACTPSHTITRVLRRTDNPCLALQYCADDESKEANGEASPLIGGSERKMLETLGSYRGENKRAGLGTLPDVPVGGHPGKRPFSFICWCPPG